MKAKRLLALVLGAAMVFALAGCVDQHPDTQEDTDADTENPRLVATSPAEGRSGDEPGSRDPQVA